MNQKIEKTILRTARWIGIIARFVAKLLASLALACWMIPAVILCWLPAMIVGVALRLAVYGFWAGRRIVDRELAKDE